MARLVETNFEEGAIATSSGHEISAAAPAWVPVMNPTKTYVDEALEVADFKLHNGTGFECNFNNGVVHPVQRRDDSWTWWLKMERMGSWMSRYDYRYDASKFNPDEGRVIESDAKELYTVPGRWERPVMKAQGERAMHRFIDGMDYSNAERASQFAAIRTVMAAVEYGDLPAAIQAATSVALPGQGRNRLMGLLEDEMIYWPDFQRKDSTSADRTVPHHVPAPSNSGTSITIVGSGTTSVTISGTAVGTSNG